MLLGTGWDDTDWPEGRAPTATELDRASYGGVVYLARTDVHSAVASSALLAACPEARSAAGFVGDGLVRQQAHHLVRRAAYAAVTPAQRRAAQTAALDRAARLGIACVHECGGPDIGGEPDFLALLALEHGVERIGYWGELDGVERARELGAVGAGGDLTRAHEAELRDRFVELRVVDRGERVEHLRLQAHTISSTSRASSRDAGSSTGTGRRSSSGTSMP